MRSHQKRHLLTSVFVILSFLMAFAVFVERLEVHRLMGFDGRIIRLVQRKIDNPLTEFMKFFTFLGSPPVVATFVALTAGLLYRNGHRREALGMVMANAAGAGFNEGLKYMFRRQRPDIHRLVPVHGYSFPSGHSMGSVMFYGTLFYFLFRRASNWLLKAIALVASTFMVLVTGMSRIYLGVHYPSDVISGYAAAGAWLSASMKGFRAFSMDERE